MADALLSEISPLQDRHRNLMLDLVLEWAAIDGTLGWFLSMVHGFDPAEGAVLIEGMKTSQIFADAVKAIRSYADGANAARRLKKMKATYESYAFIRNLICHAKCVGVDANDQIVFLKYAEEGGGLRSEALTLDHITSATSYAKALTNYLWTVSNNIEAQRPVSATTGEVRRDQ